VKRHLLSAADLTHDDAVLVLDTARELAAVSTREVKKLPTLRGRTVVNLFFEDSTRTRISFEAAAKRLSADVINFSAKGSSVSKGESLKDTAMTLQAMGADGVVIRHGASGAPHRLATAGWIDAAVVNAGDGTHEHPSQGLLDLMTVKEHKGRISGLKIAIIGDISHSRVAHSDIIGFSKMGAKVFVSGPATLIPREIEKLGATVCSSMTDAVKDADVVMPLRIQKERQNDPLIPSFREYATFFGINRQVLQAARPDALLMHPGPINRGVELAPDVADSSQSVILDQVTNGVAVRMALMYLVLGGK